MQQRRIERRDDDRGFAVVDADPAAHGIPVAHGAVELVVVRREGHAIDIGAEIRRAHIKWKGDEHRFDAGFVHLVEQPVDAKRLLVRLERVGAGGAADTGGFDGDLRWSPCRARSPAPRP